MRLYFSTTTIVKLLAKRLVREVRSWGDEISLATAQTIVSRTFGYDDFRELNRFVGLGDPSIPDRSVTANEQAKRFQYYVDVFTENDFSRQEAAAVITKIGALGWWGFGTKNKNREVDRIVEVKASPNRMQFRDQRVVKAFFKSLRRGINKLGITTTISHGRLTAKIFGYDTAKELVETAGHGVPSPSDWYVSPEELDRRVSGYLSVLTEVGLDETQATYLLQEVGAEGWWSLASLAKNQGSRQQSHSDRIEGTGNPTWRPDGRVGSVLHRRPKPAKEIAFVILEDDGFGAMVIHVEFVTGEELTGYCDEQFATFLDVVDLSVRTEIVSIYLDIREVPDVAAAFFVNRDAGNSQFVSHLVMMRPGITQGFGNYAKFAQWGGRQRLLADYGTSTNPIDYRELSFKRGDQSIVGPCQPVAAG